MLTVDGLEVLKMAKETLQDEGKPAESLSLFEAMQIMVKDTSGNSYDFVLVHEGLPYKLNVDWGED